MNFSCKKSERFNKIGRFLVLSGVGLALIVGQAGALAQVPAQGIVILNVKGPVHYGRSAKVKATVQAIDLDTRHLTVKGSKGYLMTMRVEERVRNLSEAKLGDEVTLRYNESVGLEIRLLVEDEASPDEGATDAAPEEEMMAGDGQRILSAVVEAVAAKQKTLTLKDEAGNFISLYIRDGEVLDSLEAGQRVLVRHTEAAVVSIELPNPDKPVPKKKKK